MSRGPSFHETYVREQFQELIKDENGNDRVVIQVTGDRDWNELQFQFIYDVLAQYDELLDHKPVFINGAAPGVDLLAGDAGLSLDWRVLWAPAEWDKFGRAAGPRRNAFMLSFAPAILLVFHNALHRSKGTLNCVQQAFKLPFPPKVYLFSDLRPRKTYVLTPEALDVLRTKGAAFYDEG